jgi:ubiquinone/menaquinone biosynthesis C-methylase UbiE
MTDLRPDLLSSIILKDSRVHIEKSPINAEELPYKDDSFDRVIATCLLIHLRNPEKALQEWRRVCKPNGNITIYIPCESGVLLRSLQAITTRKKQSKLGIDARYLHYQEHPYSYPFILSLLKRVFGKNFRLRKFPFLIGNFDINLWAIATINNVK